MDRSTGAFIIAIILIIYSAATAADMAVKYLFLSVLASQFNPSIACVKKSSIHRCSIDGRKAKESKINSSHDALESRSSMPSEMCRRGHTDGPISYLFIRCLIPFVFVL